MLNVNPLSNYRFKYVDGLELTILGDETLSIAAGQCRDSDDTFQIVSDDAITVSNTFAGVNGLDQGTVAASTLYAVYLIGDLVGANLPAGLLSLSSTSPLMPYGYNAARLLGWVRTDGTSDFLAGKFYGHSGERVFMYDAPLATPITSGAATTYTAVDLVGLVPNEDGLPVIVGFDMTPAAASRIMSLQPFGGTGNEVSITSQVTAVQVTGNVEVLAGLDHGVAALNYKWSAGGGDAVALNVAGYRYSLS
jgi:hypothetical protein